jgi:hypothetical protein
MLRDIAHALRQLRLNAGFAAIALCVVADPDPRRWRSGPCVQKGGLTWQDIFVPKPGGEKPLQKTCY